MNWLNKMDSRLRGNDKEWADLQFFMLRMKCQECKTQDLQLIRIVIPVYNFAITSVMIGNSGAYIEGELCTAVVLFFYPWQLW